jgi:hypothetical protein
MTDVVNIVFLTDVVTIEFLDVVNVNCEFQ